MAGKRTRKDVKSAAQKRLKKNEDKEFKSWASTSKGLAREIHVAPTQDYSTKLTSHSRKRFLLDPDISSIVKERQTVQDENDSSYEHPFHSTAIAENSEDNEEHNPNQDKKAKMRDRSRVSEASKKKESESSEKVPSDQNIVNYFPKEVAPRTQKGMKRKTSSHVTGLKSSEAAGSSITKASHPEHLNKSSKRPSDLEVILREFDKVASEYKETVDLDVCKNAIEKMTIHFKEQLTETVTQVLDLKKLQRKNRQVIAAVIQKSKELVEMKDEQLKKEPKLKELQAKYAELQEKMTNMKNVTQFLNDLKNLQTEYMKYLEKNRKEEDVKYGAASIPAMLLDARGILGAESLLRTVNTRLNNQLKQANK